MDRSDRANQTHLYKTPLRPEELHAETKRRLHELNSNRKDLEDAFPQSKKLHRDFDSAKFLTETADQDGVSTKPQQEEAAFIMRCFRDPPCLQFQQQLTATGNEQNYCSVCGLTMEFHKRQSDDEPEGQGSDLNIPSKEITALISRLTMVKQCSRLVAESKDREVDIEDLIDAVYSAPQFISSMVDQSSGLSQKPPALTFGSVQIPMRFVGRPSYRTKEKYRRTYIKFDSNDAGTNDTIFRLWELMIRIWKISQPSVVFSVTGGLISTHYLEAVQAVSAALKKIISQTECWIISDGRNSGTSKFLGKALQAEGPEKSSPILIGATHWGSLHRKELLFGISLPREIKSSQYFYSMEYKLSQEENSLVLNPYQTAYLLLDNGLPEPGECPLRFRRKFEEYIKEIAAKRIYNLEDVTLPIVTLVIGGDFHTLGQILYSVEHKNPVILINRSGDIPSILSEVFYHLEDAHPRTWNAKAGWTTREEKALENYFLSEEKKICSVWNCQAGNKEENVRKNQELYKIKNTMQEIMEKRYYMTVIDSSLEDDESLHGSILQGIYKGYDRRRGMAIALKTGTYDFLQALFLRDVDPQFTKEHYITIRALHKFHQANLYSDQSISKVLKLMCKRDSFLETGSEDSILPVIGRILQLLLGPRYKVLYQEDKYSSESVITSGDSQFDRKKDQLWHLFLWSILSANPEMTQFFLLQTSAPLGASLLAFKLYSKLAFYSNKVHEEELKTTLYHAADHFQNVAIEILDKMYNTNMSEAYRVLISQLPFDLGPYVTPLVIADDAQAMDFISRSCCQTYLQKVWKGNMAVETPFWKSIPVMMPFMVLPWIHFDGSPIKQLKTEYTRRARKKQLLVSAMGKLRSYYTAPITKFYARMYAYFCFLGLLSYFVLTDLKPFTTFADIAPSEWIVVFWEITLIIEEIVQIGAVSDTGPLFEIAADVQFSKKIWRLYERCRMHLYVLEIYIRGGRWNSVDIAMVTLFIVSFALRYSLPQETFQMTRIIFAVTVIVCYFRVLRFWYVLHTIGPRIIAIQMMLAELLKFLMVLAVFVVSFGIAFQAILNPNQVPSWVTFADIMWRPYWEMFGELFLDDDPGMGRKVGNTSCVEMAKSAYGNGIHIHCYEWAAPVLLGIYLLISSVLLLNLLIAIFSQAYEEVSDKADKVWLFNLYGVIQEFYYQEWLPPPFSIFAHLYNCICIIIKKCRTKNLPEKEDCFRLSTLPASNEHQKNAAKEIKMYSPEK